MVFDVRATATCTLGPLISANISDDYIQLNGLIKTQGSCVIGSLITPAFGSQFTISINSSYYSKSIPKKFYVLSFFCDPFQNTTTVSFGCKLTYLSDLREPLQWTQFDDPDNAEEEPSEIVILPIKARNVAQQCCSALGINPNQLPLTNLFSIETFDFSSGYVQILSDLLVSEGYFGFMGDGNDLIVRPLENPNGSSPVLDRDKIVAITDINSGSLPGETVGVSFNTTKLNEPSKESGTDEAREDPEIDWDYTLSTGEEQSYTLNAKDRDNVEVTVEWRSRPTTVETVIYDDWGRMKQRTTTTTDIAASFAMGYFSDYIQSCDFGNTAYKKKQVQSWGSEKIETQEVTKVYYKYNVRYKNGKPAEERPEGYDRIDREITEVYEPAGKVHGSLPYNFNTSLGNFTSWSFFKGFSNEKTSYSVTEYQYAYVTNRTYYDNAVGPSGPPNYATNVFQANVITRTRYAAYGYTKAGQAEIAKATEAGKRFSDLSSKAEAVGYVDTSTERLSGRQVGFVERPSKASSILNDSTDQDYDPNNGFSTQSNANLILSTGDSGSKRSIVFDMPYAPDDTFTRTLIGNDEEGRPLYNFSSIPSDAPAKARNFGRLQNRLLYGNRHGMNIQSVPGALPIRPYKFFAVEAGGFTGLYVTNALSWVIDSTGVLVTTDAMFWRPIAGSGGSPWFPVREGITIPPTTNVNTVSPNLIGTYPNVNA